LRSAADAARTCCSWRGSTALQRGAAGGFDAARPCPAVDWKSSRRALPPDGAATSRDARKRHPAWDGRPLWRRACLLDRPSQPIRRAWSATRRRASLSAATTCARVVPSRCAIRAGANHRGPARARCDRHWGADDLASLPTCRAGEIATQAWWLRVQFRPVWITARRAVGADRPGHRAFRDGGDDRGGARGVRWVRAPWSALESSAGRDNQAGPSRVRPVIVSVLLYFCLQQVQEFESGCDLGYACWRYLCRFQSGAEFGGDGLKTWR